MKTFAEEAEAASLIALEHFRESFLLCFRTMTQGLPEMYRKNAREIVKFFETETNPQIWATLATIPDPENPMQSIATSWVQQWDRMSQAIGKPEKPKTGNASALSAPEQPVTGY